MVTKSETNVNFYEFNGPTKIPKSILELRHSNEVNCIAFYLFKDTSSFILATGCQDNNIILWNINSSNWQYEQIATLSGHGGAVNSLAFYPNEQIFASGSEDNTTKIWRQSPDSTWNCVATLSETGNGKSLAFHPKKMFLATGSNNINNIKIWQFDNISNRTKINQQIRQNAEVTSFNFHPKEAILAIAFDEKIKLVSLREIKFVEFNGNSNSNSGNRPNSGNGSESRNGSRNGYESNNFDPSAPYNNHGRSRLNHPYYRDNSGGGLQNESRFFKLVSVNGKEVDGGRYELPAKTKSGKAQTRGPKDKASTAFSEICKKNNKKGECSYKFAIQETTHGSNKKVYHYQGKRVKLAKSIVLELKDKKTGKVKKVVKKYKNVIVATH